MAAKKIIIFLVLIFITATVSWLLYTAAIPTQSPWLAVLQRTRSLVQLQHNDAADIVIVGGGIAGIITAYYLLQESSHNIIIVEKDKVAHGATGHNAGQLTAYFEKPLHSLVQEFGFAAAIAAQQAVESAWQLLDDVYATVHPATPLYKCTGYIGCTSWQQVADFLASHQERVRGNLPVNPCFIADDVQIPIAVHRQYHRTYTLITRNKMNSLLVTKDQEYIAAVAMQQGCLNSAQLTEEIATYISKQYANRCRIYEQSAVTHVHLQEHGATLAVGKHTINAKRVILCTNGFEQYTITNGNNGAINTKLHHTVIGKIGYMMAVAVAAQNRVTTTISYLRGPDKHKRSWFDVPYFYCTIRPFWMVEQPTITTLLALGGLDELWLEGKYYSAQEPYPSICKQRLYNFFSEHIYPMFSYRPERWFYWHGLMGYTPTGIRRIGPEPCNPTLLYNLGCNGIGILPSIYGGKKIAGFIQGKTFEPSLFDPADSRC